MPAHFRDGRWLDLNAATAMELSRYFQARGRYEPAQGLHTIGTEWYEPIRDRAQAIIAHELAEHGYGGDHELALIAGPERSVTNQENCSRRWKPAGEHVSPFKSRLCQAVRPVPSPCK